MYAWRMARHPRFVGKELHREWSRLIAGVEPEVLAVQRTAYAATLGCPPILLLPEVYERRDLVRDLKRYRAAHAVAREIRAVGRGARSAGTWRHRRS